jgi:sigma-B regulation protein RsbU (phosphoserine phosphatase)
MANPGRPIDMTKQPLTGGGTWQERLDHIVSMMKEMSTYIDPQEMVKAYGARVRQLMPTNTTISLSRRGLQKPYYRVTRTSKWGEHYVNPWHEADKLPVYSTGLLGELLYQGVPIVIDDFYPNPNDPAYDLLQGQRSLVAIPHFDQGEAINMVVILNEKPCSFDRDSFPEQVWISNLFGRATHNLRLREEAQLAYDAVDRELKAVAAIQRSLLPQQLPKIPGLDLATYYQTSARAGGDYYDFFPLPDGFWGILIADVSGHGTPAAVLMAVTHSIAHSYPGPSLRPSEMLKYVNERLAKGYTSDVGAFVTAFYGVYHPGDRRFTFANAGHPSPRLLHCATGQLEPLDGDRAVPLGIFPEPQAYPETSVEFIPGDQIVLYTDGVTEASNPKNQMFGTTRLDRALSNCGVSAKGLLQEVLDRLEDFTAGRAAEDDRTLVVAKVQ